MASKSIISSLSWALKGYASSVPKQEENEIKKKEYKELGKEIKK